MRLSQIIVAASIWLLAPPASAQVHLAGTSDDCVAADTSLYQSSDPALELPSDRAIVRVGYWGDPGTRERLEAVAHPVHWNVGLATGVQSAASQQRGYYDVGPPVATPAVQVACREVGVVLNTYEFDHTQPVFGGGPFLSFGEKLSFPRRIFDGSNRSARRLVVRGDFKQPSHGWDEPDAVAQVNLVYYLQPLSCPELFPGQPCPAASFANGVPAFAHVIGVYDSRTELDGREQATHDGFNFFVGSPLAATQRDGEPVRFLTPASGSHTFIQGDVRWSDYRHFRAHISRAQLQKMVNLFRTSAAPCPEFNVADLACRIRATPRNVADWGIVLVAALVETFPAAEAACVRNQNATGCRNISIGVGMRDIDAFAE